MVDQLLPASIPELAAPLRGWTFLRLHGVEHPRLRVRFDLCYCWCWCWRFGRSHSAACSVLSSLVLKSAIKKFTIHVLRAVARCYFLFSLEFFSNSHVQEEYETIHNVSLLNRLLAPTGAPDPRLFARLCFNQSRSHRYFPTSLQGNRNVVQVQDLVFAGHAVVLSTFTGAQIVMCGYNRGGQRVSWWSLGFIAVVVVLAIVYAGLCFARDDKVRVFPDFILIGSAGNCSNAPNSFVLRTL